MTTVDESPQTILIKKGKTDGNAFINFVKQKTFQSRF